MFIRSGQANISDISDLESGGKSKPENPGIFSGQAGETVKEPRIIKIESNQNPRISKNQGRLLEYLSNRKYYIFAMFAVYILGVGTGALLVNNLERAEVINLCSVVDNYFTGLPAIDMTARIFGNIAVSLVFIFGAYLCGVTIFAPLICSAFVLYKGLSAGFITGVYFTGGGTSFHTAAGGLNFILSFFIIIFFILICAESMSFSSFLFKNEESFKSSMSFKNISVYSSRFMLLTVLIALATVVQTVAVPLAYAWLG